MHNTTLGGVPDVLLTDSGEKAARDGTDHTSVVAAQAARSWLLPIDPASEAEYQRNVAGSRRFAADLRQYIEDYERRIAGTVARNRPSDSLVEYQGQRTRGGDAADGTPAVGSNEAGYLAPTIPHPSQRGEA